MHAERSSAEPMARMGDGQDASSCTGRRTPAHNAEGTAGIAPQTASRACYVFATAARIGRPTGAESTKEAARQWRKRHGLREPLGRPVLAPQQPLGQRSCCYDFATMPSFLLGRNFRIEFCRNRLMQKVNGEFPGVTSFDHGELENRCAL